MPPSENSLDEAMRRKPVLTHASIVCEGMLASVNSVNSVNILEKHLWPIVAKYFPSEDFIFQDDNAPVHRARYTVEYKLRNKIKSLSWPAQSPDINIIENVWLRLKTHFKETLTQSLLLMS